MTEQTAHKTNNPWLFIAGIAVVFVLIGLSYLVFPSAPPPKASHDKTGDEPEVVFVLENEPAAPASSTSGNAGAEPQPSDEAPTRR